MRMGPSMAWICPHYNRLRMTEPFTVPGRRTKTPHASRKMRAVCDSPCLRADRPPHQTAIRRSCFRARSAVLPASAPD